MVKHIVECLEFAAIVGAFSGQPAQFRFPVQGAVVGQLGQAVEFVLLAFDVGLPKEIRVIGVLRLLSLLNPRFALTTEAIRDSRRQATSAS